MDHTPPDRPSRETFTMLAYTWDVTAALQLVEGREPNATIPITGAALWLPMIQIDEAHAATVDLGIPLLVVAVHDTDLPSKSVVGHIIIDGWHRLRRAALEGVYTLPAHLLTPDEEHQVRLNGGDKLSRYAR